MINYGQRPVVEKVRLHESLKKSPNSVGFHVSILSNFVSAPIFLNGKKVNVLEPLWLMNSSQVTDEMHDEFYRFISKVSAAQCNSLNLLCVTLLFVIRVWRYSNFGEIKTKMILY